MTTHFHNEYIAPDIEVVDIAVEAGFESSSIVEDPEEDDVEMWGQAIELNTQLYDKAINLRICSFGICSLYAGLSRGVIADVH